MPNTLIHLSTQSAASALAAHRGSWEPLFVLLGAALPDAPWILQRILRQVLLRLGYGVDPAGEPLFHDLRLYFSIQASLFFCWILALAVAVLSPSWRRVFGLLAWGALLHLILDALQIKWANGVLFVAPFEWSLVRFDLMWPESPVTTVASFASLALLPVLAWWALRRAPAEPLLRRQGWRLATVLLGLWLVLPLAYVDRLRATGAFSIRALEAPPAGQVVELGTAAVFQRDDELWVRTMAERQIRLDPPADLEPGRVSIRGRLVDDGEGAVIEVSSFHRHPRGVRETFSILGLAFIAVVWASAVALHLRRQRRHPDGIPDSTAT